MRCINKGVWRRWKQCLSNCVDDVGGNLGSDVRSLQCKFVFFLGPLHNGSNKHLLRRFDNPKLADVALRHNEVEMAGRRRVLATAKYI